MKVLLNTLADKFLGRLFIVRDFKRKKMDMARAKQHIANSVKDE